MSSVYIITHDEDYTAFGPIFHDEHEAEEYIRRLKEDVTGGSFDKLIVNKWHVYDSGKEAYLDMLEDIGNGLEELEPSTEFPSKECPKYLEAALFGLRSMLYVHLLDIVDGNPDDVSDPFDNTGATYSNSTFEVAAYSWGDDQQPFNFRWRDMRVSWYKALGRGMYVNRYVEPEEAGRMLSECAAALRRRNGIQSNRG